MICFEGCLSSRSLKTMWKKSRNIFLFCYSVPLLLMLPFVVGIAVVTQWFWITLPYFSLYLVFIVALFLPPSRKFKNLHFKIYTEDEYIIYTYTGYEEYRLISDVKNVKDHGDFYEFNFCFGKISDKFICQKDLLTCGTLDEFEAMFEGKIIRKIK